MPEFRYTLIDDNALKIAFSLARGCYQRALLADIESWSGSTLTGRAASYATKYRNSRWSLVDRLEAHPELKVEHRQTRYGRKQVLVRLRFDGPVSAADEAALATIRC